MRYVTPQLTNVGQALETVLGSREINDPDRFNGTVESPYTTDGSLSADV